MRFYIIILTLNIIPSKQTYKLQLICVEIKPAANSLGLEL